MNTAQPAAPNPFALLMDPEAVLLAMANSDRLALLTSRICRPLDKPLTGRGDAGASTAPDDAVDAEEA
jgi:hypothetical protein